MIRFFHTADIHFGVENYGRVDPATGIHSRLLDFKKSLATCVDAAIKEQIDFFLFSGDAYKTAHPSPTQQKLLMEEFFKLQQAGIPIVIIVGNHDHPLSFGKANALDVFAHLPLDGFYVFSKPDLVTIQTKNGPVQIVGIPWPTRNNVVAKEEHHHKDASEITTYLSQKVSEIISHFASEVNPNIPAVLAGHLTVTSGVFSGSEKRAVFGTDPMFLPSELALPVFDYVALGHLHRYQNLNPTGYPALVYSGSIDRVDFGERKETKGYCAVNIETNAEPNPQWNHYSTCATHEFRELQTRNFVQIEIVLEDGVSQTEQIVEAIKKYDIEHAIVKLLYHLPEGKKDCVDLSIIEKELKKAWYVVGIIPLYIPVKRSARAALKVDMDFETMVNKYIESKPELSASREELVNKIRILQNEKNEKSL